MKISNAISFISGVISIFVFVTGYSKIDEIINNNEYKKEKKKEIVTKLGKEKIPIAFEITADISTKVLNDTCFYIEDDDYYKDYYICDTCLASKYKYSRITVHIKRNTFFHLEDSRHLTIGSVQIRQYEVQKFDTNDTGIKIAEVQISGIINDGDEQYICYLFGKISYNTSMDVPYYGVGYLLSKDNAIGKRLN